MWQSIFLAQIFGPMLVVIWISLIFNEKFFKKMVKEMATQNVFIYMWGIISMFLGLYILLTVENGGYLFQSILLLFGLLAVIKWVTLLLFPKYMKKMSKDISIVVPFLKYFGGIYIVIWLYLCYAGY